MKLGSYLLIMITIFSCHDGAEQAVPSNKDIYKNEFYKPIYYYGIQTKELLVKSVYKFESETNLYSSSLTISNPKEINYSNYLNGIDYFIFGYSSLEFKRKNIAFIESFNDTLLPIEFSLSSNLDIKPEKTIIYPIRFNRDSTKHYPFSNIYYGEFKLLGNPVDSIIDFGKVFGIISADGILDFYFSGNLNFSRFLGLINSQKNINASLNSEETTDLIEFKSNQSTNFIVNSDSLDFSVNATTINSTGITVLELFLKRQYK